MNAVIADVCQKCGARLLPNDRFCSGCGAPTGTSVPPAPAVDPLLERLRRAAIGLYDVHSELGRGGMAAVYLAHDLRLQRKVAIKVMLPALFLSEGMADRFLLEARTAARLSHPNIVVIYSVSSVDDLFYFVMSLVAGAPLDDILAAERPLPVDEARWVLSQAARALQHAHNEGVVHRDVKPANIMINVRGDAVLTDFGIAKATESPHLTRTGSAVGTPAYMSPEQVMSSSDITGASDQYSLGIVAYELLTGRPPFRGSSIEVQWAHAHNHPADLGTVAPHVPGELAAIVMRMLAKKPEDRWESLEPLIDMFASGLTASGGRPRQSLAARAQTSQSSRTSGQSTTPQSPLPALSKSFTPHVNRSGGADATRADASGDVANADVAENATTAETGEAEAPQEIEVGQTVILDIDAEGQDGPVQFVSSDSSRLQVDEHGSVRALAAGEASITVIIGDEQTVVEFVITPAPPTATRLVLVPAAVELEAGESATASATARDDDSETVYALPAAIVWTTDNSAIVSCSARGELTGVAPGRTTVRATSGELTGATVVTVRPALVTRLTVAQPALSLVVRATASLSVSAFDRRGQAIANANIQYESTNRSIVLVDGAGVVEAVSPGRATVRVRSGDVQATVDVTVTAVPVAEVRVPSPAVAMEVGDALQLAASAHDSSGVELLGRPLTWNTENSNVVSITPAGLASAVAPGHAIVYVASGTVRQPVQVNVSAVPIREIRITPGVVSTVVGRKVPLTVRATDMRGRDASSDNVSWTSQQPLVCVVSDGVLQARGAGSCVVTARIGTVTTTVQVQVAAPVAKSVVVSAPSKQARVGAMLTLTATVRDAEGVPIDGMPVRWDSDAPQVATVDAQGMVRAVGVGSATISAAAGALRGSETLEVLAPKKVPVRMIAAGAAVLAGIALIATFWLRSGKSGMETQPTARDSVPATANTSAGAGGAAGVTAAAPTGTETKAVPGGAASGSAASGSAASGNAASGNAASDGATPAIAATTPTPVPPASTPATTARFTRVAIRIDNKTAAATTTLALHQAVAVSAIASGTGQRDSVLTVRSTRPDIVSVDRSGRLVANAVGTADIVAQAGNVSRSVTITVRDAGTQAAVTSGAAQTTGAAPAKTETAAPALPPVSAPPVAQRPSDAAVTNRPNASDAPAVLSSRQFETLATNWVAEQGQELAARLTPSGGNADLSNRLHKLGAQKFTSEGGLTTRVARQDGNAGEIEVAFPSMSSGGIPGTTTIRIEIKTNGRQVTAATLVGTPKFRNK